MLIGLEDLAYPKRRNPLPETKSDVGTFTCMQRDRHGTDP